MKDGQRFSLMEEKEEKEFLDFLNDHYKGLGMSPKKTWGEKFNRVATKLLAVTTVSFFFFGILYAAGLLTFAAKLIEVMSK